MLTEADLELSDGRTLHTYDVAPDGKHFVVLRSDDTGQLVVIQNWREALLGRATK